MLNKLLQNERTKLYKKVSTWILMGVIVSLMLFTLGIVKLSNVLMSSGGGTTWRCLLYTSYFLFVLAALLLAFLVFGRKEKDPMRQKDKERRRAARRAEKRHRQAQREGLGA